MRADRRGSFHETRIQADLAVMTRRGCARMPRIFNETQMRADRHGSFHETRIQADLAVMNRTGFVGGLFPREDGAHGTTEQVFPGGA